MKDHNSMITVVLMVLLVLSAIQAFQLSSIDNEVTAAAPVTVYPSGQVWVANPPPSYPPAHQMPIRYRR